MDPYIKKLVAGAHKTQVAAQAIALEETRPSNVVQFRSGQEAVEALQSQNTEIRAAASLVLERMQFLRQAGITFNGARDIYEVLGYDRLITTRQYKDRYARGGLAGRIVDVFPNATWRGQPPMELVEDEDPKISTPFEKTWKELDTRLQICAKLRRVDKLAGLSTYAALLIGTLRGDLAEELPKGSPEQLLFLTPFLGGGGPGGDVRTRAVAVDADVTIMEYDTDVASPRFGLPKSYQLRRTDISSPAFQRPVHWSRIIHVAEELLDNEVFGLPTLERVWNLLDDLDKTAGGGSEAFWLRANQGLHLNVDKDMALPDAKNAVDSLKQQSEEYKHQLTRWLRTRGVEVNTLGSDVANFSSPVDAIVTLIAGSKGIPKRLLVGSEMGELASTQDRDNWKDQINGRQSGYAGPYIVRPLVDRLIAYKYLPTPTKGPNAYEVKWPQIQVLTEAEKSAGAKTWAETNSTNGTPIFTEAEIREKWYGMEPLSEDQKNEIREEKEKNAPPQLQGKPGEGAPFEEDDEEGEERSAEDLEMLRALEEALEAGSPEVAARILGGPGSGWHAEDGHVPGSQGGESGTGKNWADSSSLLRTHGVEISVPGTVERKAATKAVVKEADKAMRKAGFVKTESVRQHTPSQQLGRSEAYSGSSDKLETKYVHPDGRTARLIARMPKYGKHQVTVFHDTPPITATP